MIFIRWQAMLRIRCLLAVKEESSGLQGLAYTQGWLKCSWLASSLGS
jgi:hypothetical protein